MDIVDKHLNFWRITKFSVGTEDCMLRIGRYIQDVSGIDPTRGYHGNYSNAKQANKIIKKHGGLINLMEWGNVKRTVNIKRGNVALVKLILNSKWIACICTGQGFAFSDENGVTEISVQIPEKIILWEII